MNGLFIHWGIYSVPAFSPERKPKKGLQNGSEWYLGRLKRPFLYGYETINFHKENYGDMNYYDFLPMFEKESRKWEPSLWLDDILSAKPRYVIFTVKHHDGVCMFPSKYGLYSTNRDYVGEIVTMLRENGIKVGLYYSLMQWGIGKKGKNFDNYVNKIMLPQLKEIVDRYNPDIIWADGDWTNTVSERKSETFLKWVHSKNPSILVNSRWGKDFIALRNTQEWLRKMSYLVPSDRYIPQKNFRDKWEHVNTVSSSWGYNSHQHVENYKKITKIVDIMNMVNSLEGRFVINIGPKPDGSFDQREKKILEMLDLEIGSFNFRNSDVESCVLLIAKKLNKSPHYVVDCIKNGN